MSETIRPFAHDRFLANTSNHYSGVKTANAFTLANKVDSLEGSRGSGEGWHKDSSFRQFKAILYLNDVHENNGPFQLIAKSHGLKHYLRDMRAGGLRFRHLRISDDQVERILAPAPDRLTTITGRAGTLILVDTASIHRGRPPVKGVRYALTNYYVERWQIDAAFLDAYRPVSAEKVWKMREDWTKEETT